MLREVFRINWVRWLVSLGGCVWWGFYVVVFGVVCIVFEGVVGWECSVCWCVSVGVVVFVVVIV